MRKFLILLLISILPAALYGQKKSDWRKNDDHWTRKNSVILTGSVLGMTGYNAFGLGHITAEYDRMIAYNLSASAMFLYAPCKGRLATDTYTLREFFYFTGIKVNYNLPVVRNWLYFRVGIGGGVGYHDIRDSKESKVAGHFVADMWWVFRATKWLELRFAPLIASPSQIIVGSRFNAPYNDEVFFYYNFWTFGAGFRF